MVRGAQSREEGAAVTRPLILATIAATFVGLCALALHPALYPNDATDTGDWT